LVYIAVLENPKAKNEIGLAIMDFKLQTVAFSQFSDSNNYSKLIIKLKAVQPSEVIVYLS
jgi:DNA mismatch repair ATPase MutS